MGGKYNKLRTPWPYKARFFSEAPGLHLQHAEVLLKNPLIEGRTTLTLDKEIDTSIAISINPAYDSIAPFP